jgi:hypothetical protein
MFDAFELSNNPNTESWSLGWARIVGIGNSFCLKVLTMQINTNSVDKSALIFEEFQRYLVLSEDMVAMSSKDALVKAARILAMQAAHYASKYGEEPLIDLGNLLADDSLGERSAVFLRDGAKTFVGVLGVVAGSLHREETEVVQ